ncbi:hypothetical protein [Embleya sp. NPDC005575]|uniref:hypothetical protein n=1 Tax=Embleya sp. NPDC005575 TaxID=3156892 RepID=UPI0033B7FACB
MSRSKALAAGAAVFAGTMAATVALSGTATAGGPSTAKYDCLTSIGISYTGKTATFTTNASHQLSATIALAPLITINNGDLTITANLGGPSGTVTFSGTAGTSGPFGPVNLGPLNKTAGTISAGQAMTVIQSASPPSATNWSVKLHHNPNNVDIWCVGKSAFSPALTY